MKQDLATTLSRTGVEFDVWFSEHRWSTNGRVEATLEQLRRTGEVHDERRRDFGGERPTAVTTKTACS